MLHVFVLPNYSFTSATGMSSAAVQSLGFSELNRVVFCIVESSVTNV